MSAAPLTADRADPGPIRLALVDDHTIVREGLRSVLELEEDLVVVAEAADPEAALRAVAATRPDVVLLDLKLGHGEPGDGLEVCTRLQGLPGTRVVVLTTFEDPLLLAESLRRGARAYVLKDVDTDELVRIIRAVHRGESGFDPRSASLAADALRAPAGDVPRLTRREIEILRLLAEGLTNREIGERTYLSESTVKFHLRGVMSKLGARHRTEAVYAAVQRGLL